MPAPKTKSKTKNAASSKTVSQEAMVILTSPPPLSQERLKSLQLKCDSGRWFCLSRSPFYGQLMMSLQDRMSYAIPTAATNGETIIWNPYFLEKLTDQEVRFVLIHETLHCAYGHIWRFPPLIDDKGNKKKDEKGNIACDHAINLSISASGIDVKMPEGGLADIKYKGLAEEEIYRLLPDSQGKGYGPKGDPTGEFIEPGDGGEDGKDKNGDGDKKGKDGKGGMNLRDEWERRLIQAAQAAKASGQGNLPADLQRILDDRMAVRIDWRNEMVDFLKTSLSIRNDWTRSPNKHAHSPVIMPRKRRDTISFVVFVRDTSGSVDDFTVSLFNSMIDQCIAEMGCCGLIFDCDTIIHHEYPIGPGLEVSKTAKGGGGTDFRDPFKRTIQLQEEGENIAGLVYLTDLAGSFPDVAPEFPTLWLSITKDSIAPFGRTVYIEKEV